MGILWIILIGFVAGMIARYLAPGPNNPSGFILTVVLGIAGSFLATFLGQAVGWYRADQGAGSSAPPSAPSSFCLSGIDSSRAASFLIPARVTKLTLLLARDVDSAGPGGEGGIRTPDTLASMPHFECGAFNHSATSPEPETGL